MTHTYERRASTVLIELDRHAKPKGGHIEFQLVTLDEDGAVVTTRADGIEPLALAGQNGALMSIAEAIGVEAADTLAYIETQHAEQDAAFAVADAGAQAALDAQTEIEGLEETLAAQMAANGRAGRDIMAITAGIAGYLAETFPDDPAAIAKAKVRIGEFSRVTVTRLAEAQALNALRDGQTVDAVSTLTGLSIERVAELWDLASSAPGAAPEPEAS